MAKTVKELIEELSQFNEDAKVVVYDDEMAAFVAPTVDYFFGDKNIIIVKPKY